MKVDVAIITTLPEEFEAVLQHFKASPFTGSSGRTYGICDIKTQAQKNATIAVVRSSEQGSDTSQQVTNDIIRDLDPTIILVVGIADGVPHDEFTLGDVVISSRIHNFNASTLQVSKINEFDMRGGIHPLISDITASLALYKHRLTVWNTDTAIGIERPGIASIRPLADINDAWNQKLQRSLDWHFGKNKKKTRSPTFISGGIASSNTALHDPQPLIQWLQSARSILAIETESAGVYQAAQQLRKQYPVMSIRGISNIVGLEADPRWISYACHAAASFAYTLTEADILTLEASAQNKSIIDTTLQIKEALDTTTSKREVVSSPTETKPSQPASVAPNTKKSGTINIFISSSPIDEKYEAQLKKHLSGLLRLERITLWSTRYISAGSEWIEEQKKHIRTADIILLLISSDYIAFDYLYETTMRYTIEQYKGKTIIVPILLRPCDWQDTFFGSLQPLPRNGKPINTWHDTDLAYTEIVKEIQVICERINKSRDTNQPSIDLQSKEPLTPITSSTSQTSIQQNGSDRPPTDIYPIGKIFKRSGTPTITFVESEDFKYLKQDLSPEGRSIIIEGPSGIGKTSAINRASASLAFSQNLAPPLSARREEDRERLRTLSTWHQGTVIIDDFHWLDAALYLYIADYLKYLADNPSLAKKLVIIGIPHCGQALITMAPDLATRITIYKWKPASDKMIKEMIEKGERALNIQFASKAEIIHIASGSLFVAQSLCYNLCVEADIEKTQLKPTIINSKIEDGNRRTIDELEAKFWDPLIRFVNLGGYKDTTCLNLLSELKEKENGLLSLPELSIKNPELKAGIEQFINEKWLETLQESYPRIADILFYHPIGKTLVIEDPQLTFYLHWLPFSHLSRAAGKIQQEIGEKPKLFICYSLNDAHILESLTLSLTPLLSKITIHTLNDREITSEAQNQMLELAIASSTIAIILVSQKFLITSGFIEEYNLPTLLVRAEAKSTTVLPIIVAPCLFEDSGLDQFGPFNDPNRSLMEMTDIEREREFIRLLAFIKKKL